MIKKLYLASGILSIAGLLMAADSAFAQHGGGHGGGGHGGGGHGGGHVGAAHYGGGHVGAAHYGGGHVGAYHGGYHNGGYHNGGYHNGGYHNGYYHNGYYHNGYYHNGYYRNGYGYYPGILGGVYPWYDTGAFYDPYPDYSYYDAPAVQYYAPPSQPYVPYATSAPVMSDYASIRVTVPDPQAQVWFDGNSTSQTGTDRVFHTPALTEGGTYRYQIRAAWMKDGQEVSQNRTISVTPGETTVVDFAQ